MKHKAKSKDLKLVKAVKSNDLPVQFIAYSITSDNSSWWLMPYNRFHTFTSESQLNKWLNEQAKSGNVGDIKIWNVYRERVVKVEYKLIDKEST